MVKEELIYFNGEGSTFRSHLEIQVCFREGKDTVGLKISSLSQQLVAYLSCSFYCVLLINYSRTLFFS